ncbi:MAG TPA: TadE/TadG family type IV pilus assembly protein [Novosphingobium sp.]|nr:TadE/TadG family type IV pilus assembly protein [Novosphingobium sp.]
MSARAIPSCLGALWRDRSGNSIVEMSLILPVLVLLFCGAMDLGLAFLGQIRIQQAAARTMEMALAYKSPNVALSTTIIHDEGATAYGLPTTDSAGQVTADLWLECSGVRQLSYSGTCTTGTPARYASVTITDTYSWLFESIVTTDITPYTIPLRGYAEVRIQ